MSQTSNLFFEKKGRKRTMYRRPSQLGVPDALFPKDSEYLSNYKNNGSQNRVADRPRPKTSMKTDGLDFAIDKTTTPNIVSNPAVQNEVVGRPLAKNSSSRPKTNLKMDGKREWPPLKKNEYFSSSEKPVKNKGHDNLKPLEGSMEGQSEVRTQYQGKFLPRETSNHRPNSNIKTSEGEMELFRRNDESETWTDKSEKVLKTRPKTTLEKLGDLDLKTGMKENYVGHNGGQKQKLSKPKNTLQSEGLDFAEGTSNSDYLHNEGFKPIKAQKRPDFLTSEGDFESETTVRESYQNVAGRQPKVSKTRPKTTMDKSGELELIKGNKEDYPGYTGTKQKITSPKNSLQSEGLDFDLGTTNSEYLKIKGLKPAKTLKPLDHLISNGDFESETTSKETYKVSGPRNKVSKTRPKTSMDNSGDIDLLTANKESYLGQQIGIRQVAPKQNGTLQSEGLDFAQGTGKNDYLIIKDYKPIKVEKRQDFLKSDVGEFESETIFKKHYKNNGKLPKVPKLRPKTTMDKAGEIDLMTGNKERYSKQIGIRKILPPQKASIEFDGLDFAEGTQNSQYVNHKDYKPTRTLKKPDQLSSIKEVLDNESEAKKSFKAFSNAQKPTKLRPKTSLENSGDFDLKTTVKQNNEYLESIPVKKVNFQKVPDQLKSNDGQMETESVSKKSYRAWQGQKPAKAGPPVGNLRRAHSADFNFSRSSQDYFSGISTVKPVKVRVGTALKPDGGAEGKSEYHEKYQKATSMLDLRAKPSWFTDLTTPYGTLAGGQARALSQIQVY